MSTTTDLITCGVCQQTKPRSEYYASNISTCRACTRLRDRNKSRMSAIARTEALLTAFRRDAFTNEEVPAALGLHNIFGVGAILVMLRKYELIDLVGDKLHRVNVAKLDQLRAMAHTHNEDTSDEFTPAQDAPITLHDATHIEEVVSHTPPMAGSQGLFLRAGSHLINVLHIADIEILEDRSVSLMLAVQETRKEGYVAAVTFVFDQAIGRSILDSVAVLRGELPSEQIAQYEQRLARSEADREAALALASDMERTLNDIRSRLRA